MRQQATAVLRWLAEVLPPIFRFTGSGCCKINQVWLQNTQADGARQQAAAVLRWLAEGVCDLLQSRDAACRDAATNAVRTLAARDLVAAER